MADDCGQYERKRYTKDGHKCGPHRSPRKPAKHFKKGDVVIGRNNKDVYLVHHKKSYKKVKQVPLSVKTQKALRKKARRTYKGTLKKGKKAGKASKQKGSGFSRRRPATPYIKTNMYLWHKGNLKAAQADPDYCKKNPGSCKTYLNPYEVKSFTATGPDKAKYESAGRAYQNALLHGQDGEQAAQKIMTGGGLRLKRGGSSKSTKSKLLKSSLSRMRYARGNPG